MSPLDFIRLRGTVIAFSTFFTIVSLYVIIDQRSAEPVSSPGGETSTTRQPVAATTIPLDNRLCGLAQRLLNSLPEDEPAIALEMQTFYTETATFTEGDLRGDLIAASRFYKAVNDIAVKAKWDVDRIVRNNDALRWKALLTGTPTGVEESRQAVRDRCRVNLPDPPSIELDWAGRIRDPRLAALLAPIDKEIHRPAPEPEPTETTPQ
ncbi:MAG: hypothetical protein ABIQ73_00005 [Acidimicrobiales bacterium]